MDASVALNVASEHIWSPPQEGKGKGAENSEGKTALELMKQEQAQNGIVTFSAQIDEMLGGGIPVGRITEMCGPPGIGKTQLSIQVAVDVTIPELFGGLGKQAIYIDTEGSFLVERVHTMASALVDHISKVAKSSNDPEMKQIASRYTVESILSSIHYYRCHNHIELIATVNILSDFIKQNTQVALIIIDSVASHFRHDFDDMSLRNRLLAGLAQSLIRLASHYQLAVVLTNQMTTRIMKGEKSQLVPALGESWGHLSTNRIILYWQDGMRHAYLCKSPNRPEACVSYQITADGVRDVTLTATSRDGNNLEEDGMAVPNNSQVYSTRKRPHPE